MTFPWSEGAYGPFQDPGGDAVGQDIRAYRNIYFVDGKRGADGNTGLSINAAFKTVQEALDTVQDEDTIIVMKGTGNYDEKLTTGQNIRHAAMTAGRGRNVTLAAATPTSLPYNSPQLYNVSGSEYSLSLLSPGWRVTGFRLVGDSGSPICLKAEMAQAGNTADTNYSPGCTIDHCVFLGAVGSTEGLQLTANAFFRIEDNLFEGFTSSTLAAISEGSGGFTFPGRGRIVRNEFHENVVSVELACAEFTISHNVFGDGHSNTATKGLDTSGGLNNNIFMNHMKGTYGSGGIYTAGTNDNWIGNLVEGTGTGITAPWSTGDPGQ